MQKKYLLIFLILSLLLFSGCRSNERKSSDSDSFSILGPADETDKAGAMIRDINENELKRIKVIYQESESKVADLKDAREKQDVKKVQSIATELVQSIDEGMNLATDAISKIDDARKLSINEKYSEYLDLKGQSLSKEVEAFRIRFEQAKYFRDKFGTQDKREIENAKTMLNDMSEDYKKKMDAAEKLSQEANDLAKESRKKAAE